MSLSRPNDSPSSEPKRYYIGRDKPKVEHTMPDRYYYDRERAARKLDKLQAELHDEPDFDNRTDNWEDPEH